MEGAGRISEEWSSLSGFYTTEEADFMTQLLSNTCSVQHDELHQQIPNPSFHESTVVSLTGINNNTSLCFPSIVGNDSFTSFDSMCMGLAWGDAEFMPCSVQSSENTDEELVKSVLAVAHKNLQAIRECETQVSESAEKLKSSSLENSEKRSRRSLEVSKNKRNVKPKKNKKPASMSNNEEDRSHWQSSSSCCSEEYDSNGGATTSSLSPKHSAALNSNGKSMSHKGPASDPQSLYARRRRERINERLRILQNLVPNGTKVDISTMLEEAVQYVKFLQLQIKLLSSDDLWMYAPIAYNGLNIGIDLDFTPTKQP